MIPQSNGLSRTRVSENQIVMRCTGVIRQQNPAGIFLDEVIRDDRMVNAHEMNSLAAVEVFGRLKAGNAGAREGADIQADIVLHDVIVRDRNLGRVGYQKNALEICVLDA